MKRRLHEPPRPVVTVRADAAQSLYHNSYVYAGLWALAGRGEIRLAVVPPKRPRSRDYGRDQAGVDLAVHAGDRTVDVCIDVRDKSDAFFDDRLAGADVYFKRSYHRPDVEATGAGLRIRPFGANFGVVHRGSLPVLGAHAIRLSLREPRYARQYLGELFNYARLPVLADFVRPPDRSVENVVLLQTRLWEPHEVVGQDTNDAVNESRIGLVRALRNEFGQRFVGGIAPSGLARRLCPELITPHATDRRSYLALVRRSAIAIYTRGLHHSTAWKFGEYTAASCGLIAEPIRNRLPTPLVAGADYLKFETVDECLAACASALEDAELRRSLRHRSHAYFRAEIDPSARLLATIHEAVRHTANAADCA